MKEEEEKKVDVMAWVWLALTMAFMFFGMFLGRISAQKRIAKVDTIVCYSNCIESLISQKSPSGKPRTYAVYNSKKQDISDIIPVSESVYAYLQLCKKHNLSPSLGIKLRNGQIQSIIKVKPKYTIK